MIDLYDVISNLKNTIDELTRELPLCTSKKDRLTQAEAIEHLTKSLSFLVDINKQER